MMPPLKYFEAPGTAIKASNNDGTVTKVTPDNSTQTVVNIVWEDNDNHWRSYQPNASESYYQNGATKESTPSDTGDNYDTEKAGNYYNWYGATAGTGTSDFVGGDAPSSICPRGWRLPSVSGERSYESLMNIYGISNNQESATKLRMNPLNFNLSGNYDSWGYTSFQEQIGFYWMSSAANFDTNAVNFNVSQKNVYFAIGSSSRKGYGEPIRCIAI